MGPCTEYIHFHVKKQAKICLLKKKLKSHLLLHPTIKNLKNQTFQNQDTLIAKITFHSFIKKKEKKNLSKEIVSAKKNI